MLSKDGRIGCRVVMKQEYILRRIKFQAREGPWLKECIPTQEEDLESVVSSQFRHFTTVCNSSSEGSDAPKSPALICVRAQTHRHIGIYIIKKKLRKIRSP